ncbi:MAG: hypothetical protein J0H62_06645 [Rhizobiales bacterium]|nr:hypothetical protein [Hyphomicrobiales bacterium]
MTTARQIKKLVKPLLDRNPDLVQVGPWIVLKPLHHILRAILIDRTGEAGRFRVLWGLRTLVDRTDVFSIGWGYRLWPRAPGLWRWDDPTMPDALIDVLEATTLPELRPLDTLEKFVAFTSNRERFPSECFEGYHMKRVPVEAALGRLDSACWCCDQLLSGKTRWSGLTPERFSFIATTICPLLASGDRDGLIKLLHEWEAYSAKHLGLEGIWEPTPFPIERMPAPGRATP